VTTCKRGGKGRGVLLRGTEGGEGGRGEREERGDGKEGKGIPPKSR